MTNSDTGLEREAGVRTDGSTLERRFDLHEAARASTVTVIGDGESVSEFNLIYLNTRGVGVSRLTGTPQEISAELSG